MDASTSIASPARRDFVAEFAEAYRSVALRKADMVRAAHALEAVRSALADRRTGLRALDALDDQIGLADTVALRETLVELRDVVFACLVEEERGRLARIAERDAEAAAREWLQTYSAALSFWRLDLCRALAQNDLAPPRFPELTEAMLRDDWTPTRELFLQLAESEVATHEQRASFFVYAAQVELYHLLRPDAAHELLERAAELAPEAAVVIAGFGEYWLDQGDTAKAKELFLRAVERDPRSDAAKLMGDALDRERATDEAERWYLDAIARAPGLPDRYLGLISAYARPEGSTLFETRALPLVERALAVDPDAAYSTYVSVGDCFERLGEPDRAAEWWDRAIAHDPTRPQAYVNKGYSFAGRQQFAPAREAFTEAIRVAPDWVNGYWGMAWVCEQEQRYDEALALYESVSRLRPSWEPQVEARRAAVYRGLGDWRKGEEAVLSALRAKPHDSSVLAELHNLATAIQDELDETERAAALLQTAREIEGDSYEAHFRNRVGNLYYAAGRYEEAAEAYRASIAADPNDAVVRRNLAAAGRMTRLWDEAREQLEEGLRLDGDRPAYEYGLAMLRNEQGHELYEAEQYSESIGRYQEAADLLPEDAVLHSNLANAWWNSWRPGGHAEALGSARAALERALELDAGNEDYATRLAQVRFEQELLNVLGEPPGLEAMPRMIAIELAPDVLDLILAEGTQDLNAETLEAIAAFRARYHERSGLAPSGVRFASSDLLPESSYQLYLVEHPVGTGFVERGVHLTTGGPERVDGVELEPRSLPWLDAPVWAVTEGDAPAAAAAGMELWGPIETALRHLEQKLSELVLRVPA